MWLMRAGGEGSDDGVNQQGPAEWGRPGAPARRLRAGHVTDGDLRASIADRALLRTRTGPPPERATEAARLSGPADGALTFDVGDVAALVADLKAGGPGVVVDDALPERRPGKRAAGEVAEGLGQVAGNGNRVC